MQPSTDISTNLYFYPLPLCKHVNVIYYKKFDSDCQSHSDDNINLKGLSVLINISFLVYFSFAFHPHYWCPIYCFFAANIPGESEKT